VRKRAARKRFNEVREERGMKLFFECDGEWGTLKEKRWGGMGIILCK